MKNYSMAYLSGKFDDFTVGMDFRNVPNVDMEQRSEFQLMMAMKAMCDEITALKVRVGTIESNPLLKINIGL